MLFEHGLNVSWGVVVIWLAGGLTIICLAAGWHLGEEYISQIGLAFLIVASSLTVIQDNAKTRRVVRASVREQEHDRMRVL